MTPLVFITGASSGIGQALALRFYQAGYRLALTARRTQEVKSWAEAENISASGYAVIVPALIAAAPFEHARAAVDGVGRGP